MPSIGMSIMFAGTTLHVHMLHSPMPFVTYLVFHFPLFAVFHLIKFGPLSCIFTDAF